MKAKELDCVELKNGRKGCLLHEFPNGDFLMEPYESPEIEDQIEISKEDIKRIIYDKYNGNIDIGKYGDVAGIIQQYIYYNSAFM